MLCFEKHWPVFMYENHNLGSRCGVTNLRGSAGLFQQWCDHIIRYLPAGLCRARDHKAVISPGISVSLSAGCWEMD